jgi:hypothetical protein
MKLPTLRVSLFLILSACFCRAESIDKCFTVHRMVKSEEGRYLIEATNRCSQEYDAVYVLVSFSDGQGKRLDDGVWAIYWSRPGRHEIHEFGIPKGAVGFERVTLRKITINAEEALR